MAFFPSGILNGVAPFSVGPERGVFQSLEALLEVCEAIFGYPQPVSLSEPDELLKAVIMAAFSCFTGFL